MFAIGMLILFGSMALHVFMSMSDFAYGMLQGIGIAIMAATLYRMKKSVASNKN